MTKTNWPATRAQLWERSGGRCEATGTPLDPETFDAHHRRNKGMGGTSRPDVDHLDNLLALDPIVHNGGPESVHARRPWATARGYLVSKLAERPGYFPVWQPHHCRWVNLGKDGGITTTFVPVRVGITGSRTRMNPFARDWLLERLVSLHRVGSELHHGSCTGADDAGRTLAQRTGYVTIAHPSNLAHYQAEGVDDYVFAPRPPLDRNRTIVGMVDFLIAVPDAPEHLRSGTWATVRYARRRGIPIYNWQNSEGGRTDGREPPP